MKDLHDTAIVMISVATKFVADYDINAVELTVFKLLSDLVIDKCHFLTSYQ